MNDPSKPSTDPAVLSYATPESLNKFMQPTADQCRNCSYYLGSLPSDGNCPKCGKPVIQMSETELLKNANANWLTTVIWGVRLTLLGLVAVETCIVLDVVWIDDMPNLSLLISTFVSQAILCLGFWLFAHPDEACDSDRQRRYIRGWSLIAAVSLGFTICLLKTDYVLIPLVVIALSMFATLAAQISYCRGFPKRIPDYKLARRFSRLNEAMLIILALGGVLLLIGVGILIYALGFVIGAIFDFVLLILLHHHLVAIRRSRT